MTPMFIMLIIIGICAIVIIGLIYHILDQNAEMSEYMHRSGEAYSEKLNAEFEVSYYKEELEKHGYPAYDPDKDNFYSLDIITAYTVMLDYLGFKFTGEITDLRQLKEGIKGDFKVMPSIGSLYVYGIDEEGINWTEIKYKDFNSIKGGND